MKRLLILVSLFAIGIAAYQFLIRPRLEVSPALTSAGFATRPEINSISDFRQVLGTTTNNLIDKSTALINSASGGRAEPLINKTVSDLQDRVKDLPEQEYNKVKAEFCRDVLNSPTPEPSALTE